MIARPLRALRSLRRGRYVLAALLLHVLLALRLYTDQPLRPPPEPAAPPRPSVVELTFAAPAPSDAADAVQEAPAPATEPAPPPLPKEPAPHRNFDASSVRAATAEAPALHLAASEPQPATALPEPQAATPPAGRPAPDSTLEQRRLSWEEQVLEQLERHKRYPATAQRSGLEDRVRLEVRVGRDGRVLAVEIVGSRGFAPLDAEALALVARADPLPAPPADIDDRQLVFRVPVEFYLERQARLW